MSLEFRLELLKRERKELRRKEPRREKKKYSR
jgi:hypothetical protein